MGAPGGAQNAIILKSDGETAIVAVREALARCHGGIVTPQQLPRGEHQANGVAEEAGRTVRDHARVLKVDLQAKMGRKVEPDEPIMPWLIRWAAMAVSRYAPGKDEKTPYERQLGRTCDIEIVPFGETVLYRMPEVARDWHQALEEIWEKKACGESDDCRKGSNGTAKGSKPSEGPPRTGSWTPGRTMR